MTISDPLAPEAPGTGAAPVAAPAVDGPEVQRAPAGAQHTVPDAPVAPADPAAPGGVTAPPAVPSTPSPSPGASPAPASARSGRRPLDVLANVEMTVTVELGRTRMPVRHLLSLSPGSVIELNRSANTPVDVFVNGTLFARAEVVVIDDEFGVRITDIVERDNDSPFERS